jgi:hypothetical protein
VEGVMGRRTNKLKVVITVKRKQLVERYLSCAFAFSLNFFSL